MIPVVQTSDHALPWWMPRHREILERIKHQERVDLVLLGDSITRGWENTGQSVWQHHYGKHRVLNLGFGGDKTQHVLWRIAHGELDGISPRLVIVSIGTNNAWDGDAAKSYDGIEEVCRQIQKKLPEAEILLVSLFPRADSKERRAVNDAVNFRLPELATVLGIRYLDSTPMFGLPDGTLRTGLFQPDQVHLNESGYEVWARALESEILRALPNADLKAAPPL